MKNIAGRWGENTRLLGKKQLLRQQKVVSKVRGLENPRGCRRLWLVFLKWDRHRLACFSQGPAKTPIDRYTGYPASLNPDFLDVFQQPTTRCGGALTKPVGIGQLEPTAPTTPETGGKFAVSRSRAPSWPNRSKLFSFSARVTHADATSPIALHPLSLIAHSGV